MQVLDLTCSHTSIGSGQWKQAQTGIVFKFIWQSLNHHFFTDTYRHYYTQSSTGRSSICYSIASTERCHSSSQSTAATDTQQLLVNCLYRETQQQPVNRFQRQLKQQLHREKEMCIEHILVSTEWDVRMMRGYRLNVCLVGFALPTVFHLA